MSVELRFAMTSAPRVIGMEIIGAQVLHPDGHVGPAVVRIESGLIAEVDDTVPARGGDFAGLTLLPGFVDAHCHGGGGGDYASGDPASIERALSFHLAQGTTTTQASLVSAPMGELCAQITSIAPFVRSGRIHGVHLEGPWLAGEACGALTPATFSPPDAESIRAMLECAEGVVTTVTIAPELPGALAAIGTLVGAGIKVAVGHTQATGAQTRAAIEAGATIATHLFNAMPPLHHREPGPVGAMLADEHVSVEVICDTVHLHPDVVRIVLQAANGRAMLVTDAVPAAGTDDSAIRIGNQNIEIADGIARVRGSGALAGSLLTMGDAVRHAVYTCGVSLADASHAASLAPARALGMFDRGLIMHSLRADIVAVDTDLRVRRVMQAGCWID